MTVRGSGGYTAPIPLGLLDGLPKWRRRVLLGYPPNPAPAITVQYVSWRLVTDEPARRAYLRHVRAGVLADWRARTTRPARTVVHLDHGPYGTCEVTALALPATRPEVPA